MTDKLTQEAYFIANAVDGKLTDAQTMEMLFLPSEADTTDAPIAVPEDSSKTADAAQATDDKRPVAQDGATPASDQTPNANAVPAEQPVVLAKDGVHTIPYAELERARAAERELGEKLAQAQAQLAAIHAPTQKQEAAAPAVVLNSATGEYEIDLGDFSEDAIKNGVKNGIEAGVAAKTAALVQEINALKAALAPIQQQQAQSEDDAHFGAINKAHPDIESVLPSQEYGKWLSAQPRYVQSAINAVIEGGTAAEVIEVMDRYKAETGIKTIPVQVPSASGAVKVVTSDPNVLAAAKAAIATAKTPVPNSLSEIPAGAAAHHNQADAVLNMSTEGHLQLFLDKTPEQIEAILAKTL